MAGNAKKGKLFMQDKDKLLKLAETITSEKEHDTRQKVDRTKAAGSSHDGPFKQKFSKRPKSGSASAKLRAAKELVAARKAKHKRDIIKTRKGEKGHGSSGGAPRPDEEFCVIPSTKSVKRKRVSFA